jgi:predicted nuclease of predicted toxin-antitoxin system
MRLYLDDDTASGLLARLLRQAGHDVQLPAEVGMVGKKDPVHLAHAVRADRVFLTKNYCDFRDLHDLALALRGQHPGILVIRYDNDRKRDLKLGSIVRALANLQAANVVLVNGYFVLNQWR